MGAADGALPAGHLRGRQGDSAAAALQPEADEDPLGLGGVVRCLPGLVEAVPADRCDQAYKPRAVPVTAQFGRWCGTCAGVCAGTVQGYV